MYGVPYAVAMKKGFFKEAGIDVTGILTSKGGGTTVRNVLEGGLPFGEVALSAAIAAIQEGADIKIVMGAVRSAADVYWVTMPDSPIKSVKDLVGKKMAITSPKSVTDMLSTMVLNKHGLFDKVERPALGSVGAGLTALEIGAGVAVHPAEEAQVLRGGERRIERDALRDEPELSRHPNRPAEPLQLQDFTPSPPHSSDGTTLALPAEGTCTHEHRRKQCD